MSDFLSPYMRRFGTHSAHRALVTRAYSADVPTSARWAESVPKRRIGGKKITHSLAPLAPLRSVPRRTAPLHSAGGAPLRSAPLAVLVRE